MSNVIGVLSGKGGVGKTSVVANLGAALTNEFEKDVVILDADLNSSHLGMHLGMYDDAPVTLRDVLRKKASIENGIYIHPPTGIRIVPAPLDGNKSGITKSKLKAAAKKMSKNYEMVIIDCSPGLGKEVVTSISAIDSALVVVTPDFPSIVDALKTLELLGKMKKKVIGIVVNRHSGQKHELTEKEIESVCGKRIVGTIPEDLHVQKGVSQGVPAVLLSPYSKSSMAFKQLAGKLVGEKYRSRNALDSLRHTLSY